jgi:hypothetical protein
MGTQRQMEILSRVASGKALPDDVIRLQDVGWTMTDASLCGLGQTAGSAVLSAIKLWPELFQPGQLADSSMSAKVEKKSSIKKAKPSVAKKSAAKAKPVKKAVVKKMVKTKVVKPAKTKKKSSAKKPTARSSAKKR